MKYARGLESEDQYATKVENQTPTGVTVKLDALRALTRASCRSTKSYFTSSSTVLNTINTNKRIWIFSAEIFTYRRVHALRGIMGNQGKFTKKQSSSSCKTNVFPYISVLISHLVTKHIQRAEKPLFSVYQRFWVDRVNVVGARIFELFFCKKIPLSRRVGYVMDGSMGHWVSEWVSEWGMYVCHTNQIGSTINSQSNFFF